ncbi:hypothetical protein DFP73DRAFT_238231 [Morchella snyderi]|nr:hypothetical protein DFP73DRAFT_238231 [Morchella snyderi]
MFGIGIGDICIIIQGACAGWEAIASYSQDHGLARAELAVWRPALNKLSERVKSQSFSPEATAMAQFQLAECDKLLEKLEKLINARTPKGTRHVKWAIRDKRTVEEALKAADRRMRSLETTIMIESVAQKQVILMNTDNRLVAMPLHSQDNTIQIVDAMDEEWNIPMQICRNWEALHRVITLKFEGAKGTTWVRARRYQIKDEISGLALGKENWQERLKPGMRISMAMELHKNLDIHSTQHKCPRCDYPHPGITSDHLARVRCRQCRTFFEVSSRLRIISLDGNEDEDEDGDTKSADLPKRLHSQSGEESAIIIDEDDVGFFRRLHLVLYRSHEMMTITGICSHPLFTSEEIDMDFLCTELRAVAFCTNSGIRVPMSDVLRILDQIRISNIMNKQQGGGQATFVQGAGVGGVMM